MTIDLHFHEQDWARLAQDWSSWWAGELPRPLVVIDGMPDPDQGDSEEIGPWEGFVTNLPAEAACNEVLQSFEAGLRFRRCCGDGWPRWWPNFGPGVVAAFLGAQVQATLDTVWFAPSAATTLETMQLAYDPHNLWWQRVRDLTRAAVERWGDSLCVGFTDLGGNLDILASLRTTQKLLVDLVDDPESVARLSASLTRLWLGYYEDLYAILRPVGRGTTTWAPLWSPGRGYMLQSDFAYMISPRMFERFVLPDLDACCQALDYAFYHLDGKGQIPHLDMLLSLARLRGIQWVPGDGAPPPEAWLPLLQRIRSAGKLCQLTVSPHGAREIVRALGGKGFAFYIQEPMYVSEARSFLDELAAQAPSAPFG